MIENIKGQRVSINEIADLKRVCDILYFDGPFLSLFRGDRNQDYLYYWVDSDDVSNRWLIFPIGRSDLKTYLSGNISLLAVMESASRVIACDIDAQLKKKNVREVTLHELPSAYAPAADDFLHSDDLTSAARALLEEKTGTYSIKIQGDWYLEDLADVPKTYRQIYAFIYGMKHSRRASVKSRVQGALNRYPWRGGHSTVNLFRSLADVIPSIHAPKLKSMYYNSPGHIDIDLELSIAEEIASLSEKLLANKSRRFEELQTLYQEVNSFLRENNLFQLSVKDVESPQTYTQEIDIEVRRYIQAFNFYLNLEQYQTSFEEIGGHPLAVLKALLSYFRRVATLVRYSELELISLHAP